MCKEKKNYLKLLGVTLSILFLSCSTASSAKAVVIDAIDMVGQADQNGDALWEASSLNNGANLYYPKGVAFDNVHHRMFVVAGRSSVYVYNLTADNSLTDKKPDFVLGVSSLQENSQTGTSQNQFAYLHSLAYDPENNRLFVADQGNSRVLVFDTANLQNGMNAAYVLGQTDFFSNMSSDARSGMSTPTALAYDSTHKRLFVGDAGNYRLLVFDLSGGIANGMEAQFVVGGLNNMNGIAYDSQANLLFVGDTSSGFVRVFDAAALSDTAVSVHYFGGSGTPAGTFYQTGQLAVDETNKRLFVGDANGLRVMIFDYSTGIVDGKEASFVLGQPDFFTRQEDAGVSTFVSAEYLAYDPSSQNILISAGDQGYKIFDVNPASLTSGENPVNKLTGVDQFGLRQDSSFQGNSTYLDVKNHRLFVADVYNNRVLVYVLDDNNLFRHHYADYVLGQKDMFSAIGKTSQDGFKRPKGIAYDEVGERLFVADANNYRILIFDLSSGITNGMNASYVLGQTDFVSANFGTSQSSMGDLDGGILYDTDSQNLFVGDYANSRVLVFDLSGSITNGMNAAHVLGQMDFTTVDYNFSQNILGNDITGFSYDKERKLFFVSDNQNRIMIFDLSSGITNGMNAAYVLGQTDFVSNASGVSQNQFDAPRSSAYDSTSKRLYVGDRNNNRIMVFDLTTITNGEDAVEVFGQNDFVSKSALTARNTLRAPASLALDVQNGRMFVNDRESARVTITSIQPFSISSLANPTLNQNYNQQLTITGGTAPFIFEIADGSLPAGLALSQDGIISGIPNQAGSFSFTVRAIDADSKSATRQFTLTIGSGENNDEGGIDIIEQDVDRIVPIVTSEAMRDEFLQSYINVEGPDLTQANRATFAANYQFGSTDAKVFVPKETVVTTENGKSFDLTGLVNVANLKTSLTKTLGTLKFGIPNFNLLFSKSITISLAVDPLYNGRKVNVFYKKENENVWHKETVCTIQNAKCTFQTNHATTFAVVKDKLVDRNSDRYQRYLEKRRNYKNDLNEARFFSVRNMKKTAEDTYLELKNIFENFDKKNLDLDKLDPKIQEQIRTFRGYRNYKEYTDLRETVKDK